MFTRFCYIVLFLCSTSFGAYTEFYVTQHADANTSNGGSGVGASKTGTVQAYLAGSGTGPYVLTLVGGGVWSTYGVSVGDWGLWDCTNETITSRQSFVVTELTSTTEISVMFGVATPTAGPKSLRVGGAWPSLSSASTVLNQWGSTTWIARGPGVVAPPRVNIHYAGGTPYTTLMQWATNGWAAHCPCFIEAYETNAGDLPWWTTDKRAVIETSADYGVQFTAVSYYFLRNLHFVMGTGTVTGVGTGTVIYAFNCVVSSASIGTQTGFSTGTSSCFVRCFAMNQSIGFTVTSSFLRQCTAYACATGIRLGGYSSILDSAAIQNTTFGVEIFGTINTSVLCSNVLLHGNLVGLLHSGALQAVRATLLNSSITSNTAGVSGTGAATQGIFYYGGNNFYGNTGDFNLMDSDRRVDLGGNIAVDPGYVNAATGDFRLTRTSGQKGTAIPNSLLVWNGSSIASVNHSVDIGAFQRVESIIPSETDVRLSVQYGDGGTEKTGTLNLPAIGDVQEGVWFDGGTKTGTLVLPDESEVKSPVPYGNAGEFVGIFESPAEEDVVLGVPYGAMEEYLGEYTCPASGITAQELRDAMNMSSNSDPISPSDVVDTKQKARNAMNLSSSD